MCQAVTVASDNIVGLHATHDQVHAGEVVGVLAQLLGKVLDAVRVAHALGNGLADVEQQRAGARGRVIDLNLFAALEVVGDDVAHNKGHLMRSVELASFLTCVGRELLDEVLVDVAEHVVALLAVGGDVINEVQQLLNGGRTRSVGGPQLR